MQKRKGLHSSQDCSPLGSGWNHVRDIKENNWVVRTPGWVILYWREEYTGWSNVQSVRLWRQEYCAPPSLSLPSPSAFPDHPPTFSTVRYNVYDSAFSQKTRVLPFYQKGRTGKGNTQMTVTERSSALCILYQCLRMYQFSHSVVSNSLRLHGPQHARLPCPSPTPGVYPNSCPLSQWCHPTISSSVIPFSSHLPFFPASGSFPMS